MTIRTVAVVDIGKTNAKMALVDLERLAEIDVRKTPNAVLADGPYPHYDIERLWQFILDGLAAFRAGAGVDAVSVTTHGVAAALLDASGDLALPVLDYEYDGPERMAAEYDAVRPPFSESGTPKLPVGLNLGAQIFWQSHAFPDAFARVATILTYPQYWALRLCGVAANEATSLGCHSDLWSPATGDFSTMVDRLGWRRLMAPVRPATTMLGPILPDIAARTGLDPATPVFCGIHDSNASLLPHLMWRKPPFAVVSTGTWVISMAVGGAKVDLDPARDTLVNVNAFGRPVPSARFMGGREYAMLTEGIGADATEVDVNAVLTSRVCLSPSVQPGSGPMPQAKARWHGGEPHGGERAAAASLYLAMMTATCLGLIGAEGDIVIEGPFAANAAFCRMLAAATGRDVVTQEGAATGTSIGAALLASDEAPAPPRQNRTPPPVDRRWAHYSARWRTVSSV